MKTSLMNHALNKLNRLIISGLVLACCSFSTAAEKLPEKEKIESKSKTETPESLKKRPWEVVKVSKETTFFTKPLREDGTVDYLKAVNQLNKPKNLTAKTNGAAVIVTVLKKELQSEQFYENLLLELELEKDAIQGPFLISLFDAIKMHQKEQKVGQVNLEELPKLAPNEKDAPDIDDLLDRSQSGPWKSDEQPILTRWITENEKPLVIIENALNLPHFYMPYVSSAKEGEQEMLYATLLPVPQQYRSIARVLKARAMLHLGEGRIQKSLDDLMLMHKLARKISDQTNTLIEQLIGLAIENMALEGDQIVAFSGKLNADQLRTYRLTLKKLEPVGNIQQAILVFERVGALDAVVHLSQRKAGEDFNNLFGMGSSMGAFQRIFDTLTIDWNQVLININAWYDQYDNTSRKSYQEIQKQMKAIETHFTETNEIVSNPTTALKAVFWGRNYRSKVFSDVLLSLVAPAIGRCYAAEERCKMEAELTEITFALAEWKKAKKSWPKSLKQLVPEYLVSIPNDRFSNEELKYKSDGKTFLLYSVGDDGVDNGGNSNRRNDDVDQVVTSDKVK